MPASEKSLRDEFIANVTAEVEARSMWSPAMIAFLECITQMDDEAFERTALAIINDRSVCTEGM